MNPANMVKDIPTAASPPLHCRQEEAEDFCRDLAASHYENFTVGSFFIPKRLRQPMANVYAFCRWSDDLGDESGNPIIALQRLEDWEKELHECYEGKASHPIFIALQKTIEKFSLPKQPFWELIQAFKQDQTKTRYNNFEEVLNYCRYSANPVGRLVLYLFNYRDNERQALSDKTCTALQLANFWQDIKRDLRIGRIYLPLDDMGRFQVTEADLHRPNATPAMKSLLKFQIHRTRRLFQEGRALVRQVQGFLKIDLEAFTQGGLAVLEGIEKIDYDVLFRRPVVTRFKKLKILFSAFARFVRL